MIALVFRILSELLGIRKSLRDIAASQARLEALEQQNAAVLADHTARLIRIESAVTVEPAVTIDIPEGPIEEQPQP